MKKPSTRASLLGTPKQSRSKIDRYAAEPYARILVPDPAGGFSAEVLEFPGCFAEGNTPDEAFANLEKAATSWIEVAESQGQEIPRPSASHGYSGKLVVRLPRELHRRAAEKAERDRVSLNQCLTTAVAAWVGADDLYHRLLSQLQRASVSIYARLKFVQVQAPKIPAQGPEGTAILPGIVSNITAVADTLIGSNDLSSLVTNTAATGKGSVELNNG